MNPHFIPVGNPAPPRPRSPESLTSWMRSSGCAASALRNAPYPSSRSYTSMLHASGDSQRLVSTGASLLSASCLGAVTCPPPARQEPAPSSRTPLRCVPSRRLLLDRGLRVETLHRDAVSLGQPVTSECRLAGRPFADRL